MKKLIKNEPNSARMKRCPNLKTQNYWLSFTPFSGEHQIRKRMHGISTKYPLQVFAPRQLRRACIHTPTFTNDNIAVKFNTTVHIYCAVFYTHTDDIGIINSVNIIIITVHTLTYNCSVGDTNGIIIVVVRPSSTLYAGSSGACKVGAFFIPLNHIIHIVTPASESFHSERQIVAGVINR